MQSRANCLSHSSLSSREYEVIVSGPPKWRRRNGAQNAMIWLFVSIIPFVSFILARRFDMMPRVRVAMESAERYVVQTTTWIQFLKMDFLQMARVARVNWRNKLKRTSNCSPLSFHRSISENSMVELEQMAPTDSTIRAPSQRAVKLKILYGEEARQNSISFEFTSALSLELPSFYKHCLG